MEVNNDDSNFLVWNIIYSAIILCVSILYYKHETADVEHGKFKRRLSINMFDKYLETEGEAPIGKVFSGEEIYAQERKNSSYIIQDVISLIKIECRNFLMAEFKLIFIFCIILAVFFYIFGNPSIAIYFVIFFLLGVVISLICVDYATTIGVSNCEIVLNESRNGIDESFKAGMECSSKMSILMTTISFYTFFTFTLILKYGLSFSSQQTFEILCGYGFGCTYSALFCRIGGGIFTKGADISCDVVGRMEKKSLEKDGKNPSSIADNVGDLIGDLSGSILDLTASIAETFSAVTLIISGTGSDNNFDLIIVFFTLYSTCLLVFIISEYLLAHLTKHKEAILSDKQIESYMFKLKELTTAGMIISVIVLFSFVAPDGITVRNVLISKYVIMSTVLIGVCASYLITYSTYYFTGKSFELTQRLATLTVESPTLNVIFGLSIGYLSTFAPMIIIAVTVMFCDLFCGIFGVAFASFGFLLNLPVILLYQMFGPLADVSLGIINMVKFETLNAGFINQLDITGNTMSAVVKGFASGNAAFVSFGLFGAIMLSAQIEVINFYNMNSMVFLLFGGVFSYFIQSLCMYATSFNAILLIEESRKQLKNVATGTVAKPDYYECIQLSANHAFRNATIITWLCIFVNLAVGEFLKVNGLVSFLTGVIISGIPITISSSNSGSAWDNSKKILEIEENFPVSPQFKLVDECVNWNDMILLNNPEDEYNDNVPKTAATEKPKAKRKNSIKNAMIGDNIGDAFKDIAGPAINILIKFSSYFSLIIFNYLLIK